MFCKPGVKLILESLWAERENGGAEDQTGHTGVTEKKSRIQEGGLSGSVLLCKQYNRTLTYR